jgi:hypothetical protein
MTTKGSKVVRCNGDKAIAHATLRIQPNLTAESDVIADVRKYLFHI